MWEDREREREGEGGSSVSLVLDAFIAEVDAATGPVRLAHVDGDEQLVEGKNSVLELRGCNWRSEEAGVMAGA